MSSPCRVLILNERDPLHPRTGGAETHVHEIFRRLASRGFEITQAVSSFPGCAPERELDGIRLWRLGGLATYYPRVAWTCLRETRRGNFDLVVECLNKVPFYSPIYSAVPVLAIVHHRFGEVAFRQAAWPLAATVWTLEQLITPLYSELPFVAISDSSRSDLIARGVPADNIRVSHCGICHPEIDANTSRPRAHRVVYLGRVEPYKHVDLMLHAVAELSDRFPDTEILVVGRGSALSGLKTLARELGIDERTRFTGFVSDAERDALLAGSRVCVCPSEKEGWGLTVIESAALGTPVVARDAPGLRDSVRDGETGFLVASGEVWEFADRIGELLADDALAVRMSKASLAWSKTFDWDVAADEMAEALERARRSG